MRITHVPDKAKADGKSVVVLEAVTPSVSQPSSSRTVISVVCQSQVNEGDPITAEGHIAKSSDLSTLGRLVGLAMFSENTGFPVDVLLTGRIVHNEWTWNIGDSVFLGESSLSSEVPTTGYLQQVGIADGSNSLIVSVRSPIKI